jgi:hypothetical protein
MISEFFERLLHWADLATRSLRGVGNLNAKGGMSDMRRSFTAFLQLASNQLDMKLLAECM